RRTQGPGARGQGRRGVPRAEARRAAAAADERADAQARDQEGLGPLPGPAAVRPRLCRLRRPDLRRAERRSRRQGRGAQGRPRPDHRGSRRPRGMSFLLLAAETVLGPFVALGVVLSFAFSRRRGLLSALASELPERLGGLSDAGRVRLLGRRVWWLHAASAGEVAGLAPLIDALEG